MRKTLFAVIVFLAVFGLYRWSTDRRPAAEAAGGQLVITQRTEPSSFNRLVAPQQGTEIASRLTNATLIRVDRPTGVVEPALATEWTLAADGLSYTMKLREAQFSDGT